jgi:hypothetical protein
MSASPPKADIDWRLSMSALCHKPTYAAQQNPCSFDHFFDGRCFIARTRLTRRPNKFHDQVAARMVGG